MGRLVCLLHPLLCVPLERGGLRGGDSCVAMLRTSRLSPRSAARSAALCPLAASVDALSMGAHPVDVGSPPLSRRLPDSERSYA